MTGPTIRRRQLGRELRRLRAEAGRSSREVAEWLEVSQATVSKVENGKQAPKVAHVRLLTQLYGVRSPESEAILRLAREANQRGWWTAYGDSVPDWFRDYVGLETDASELRTYDPELVHGLLQTPGYIKAVTVAFHEERSDFDVERYVDQRQARQDRLTGGDPPTLVSVVGEGALRRQVGGTRVMRGQLEHLIEMSRLPHVTLQVLPFRAGAHPAMVSPFTLLGFEEDPDMDAVYLENNVGATYLDRPRDISAYTEVFDRVRKHACTPKKTKDFLTGLVKEL
ncbi:helix-turn-helix transcriptional regulator [Saccharopolyspora taberi]|uniref:Helix-turn-helix transcriptional regulator n=1 Tax=Saccharopolyspora taberi TaxID=60895 RepID=A0ABN3VFU8_9PSEU